MSAIIAVLIPILLEWFKSANCFNPTPKPAATGDDLKLFLADHYDDHTKKFEPEITGFLRPRARRVAREQGQHLTIHELNDVVTQTLQKGRKADPALLTALMANPTDQAQLSLVMAINPTP